MASAQGPPGTGELTIPSLQPSPTLQPTSENRDDESVSGDSWETARTSLSPSQLSSGGATDGPGTEPGEGASRVSEDSWETARTSLSEEMNRIPPATSNEARDEPVDPATCVVGTPTRPESRTDIRGAGPTTEKSPTDPDLPEPA